MNCYAFNTSVTQSAQNLDFVNNKLVTFDAQFQNFYGSVGGCSIPGC